MAAAPITVVRFKGAQARARLDRYMSAGQYEDARPPRGIDPAEVAGFLRERITPESESRDYSRALDLMRFYELSDVLPHLREGLRRPPRSHSIDDLLRCMYVVEAIGDLGGAAEILQAAAYFEQAVLTNPEALNAFAALGETAIALTSETSVGQLQRLLSHAIANYPRTGAARDYQRLISEQRNEIPKLEFILNAKRTLLKMALEERRGQLAAIYLKRSPVASGQMEVWAARLLRSEAMRGNAGAVCAEFGRAMDAVEGVDAYPRFRAFTIQRAAQAILYLGGSLSAEQRNAYGSVKAGAPNFLWDDLNF